jgi:hypothetical protein
MTPQPWPRTGPGATTSSPPATRASTSR